MELTLTPGYQLGTGEKLNNQKFNRAVVPTVTVSGAVEDTELKIGRQFRVTSGASVANAYVGQSPTAAQNPTELLDGMVVAFNVPTGTTNTGASTFELKKANGDSLTAKAILKRGRAVIAGDILAGEWVELRYDAEANAAAGAWLMMGSGKIEQADIVPGPVMVGTDATSTATAFIMTVDPAPTALAAGQRVRFAAPLACGVGSTFKMKNAAGTDIGTAAVIRRINRSGSAASLAENEIVSGQWVELVYNGTYWILLNDQLEDGIGIVPVLANALVVTNNAGTPNTQIDIDAAELVVANAGGALKTLALVDVTVNIAGSAGANAIDTGAPSSGVATWYYLYVIYNASSTTVAGLVSASATSPTLPSGYTFYCRVGAVLRTAGDVFIKFTQYGRQVWLEPIVIIDDTAAAVAYASLSLAAAVPNIARTVSGAIGKGDGFTAGLFTAVAADANGLGELNLFAAYSGDFNSFSAAMPFRLPLKTAQTIYWKAVDVTANNRLIVTGYEI